MTRKDYTNQELEELKSRIQPLYESEKDRTIIDAQFNILYMYNDYMKEYLPSQRCRRRVHSNYPGVLTDPYAILVGVNRVQMRCWKLYHSCLVAMDHHDEELMLFAVRSILENVAVLAYVLLSVEELYELGLTHREPAEFKTNADPIIEEIIKYLFNSTSQKDMYSKPSSSLIKNKRVGEYIKDYGAEIDKRIFRDVGAQWRREHGTEPPPIKGIYERYSALSELTHPNSLATMNDNDQEGGLINDHTTFYVNVESRMALLRTYLQEMLACMQMYKGVCDAIYSYLSTIYVQKCEIAIEE